MSDLADVTNVTFQALHWMTRPQEVIAGVKHVLKPGGRFVAEFGGYLNVAGEWKSAGM